MSVASALEECKAQRKPGTLRRGETPKSKGRPATNAIGTNELPAAGRGQSGGDLFVVENCGAPQDPAGIVRPEFNALRRLLNLPVKTESLMKGGGQEGSRLLLQRAHWVGADDITPPEQTDVVRLGHGNLSLSAGGRNAGIPIRFWSDPHPNEPEFRRFTMIEGE